MPRFRKKSVVIEAEEWDGTNINMIRRLVHGEAIHQVGGKLIIATLEGQMTASMGDWIIKGIQGELYPCKPDIFAETYELAEEE